MNETYNIKNKLNSGDITQNEIITLSQKSEIAVVRSTVSFNNLLIQSNLTVKIKF